MQIVLLFHAVICQIHTMAVVLLLILTLPLITESYRLPMLKDNSIDDPLLLKGLLSKIKSFFDIEYLNSDSPITYKGIYNTHCSKNYDFSLNQIIQVN